MRDAVWYMVKHFLQHAKDYEWTRRSNNFSLALQDGVTISVFDSRYCHRDARTIHSHNSDFQSRIVAGLMRHSRYTQAEAGTPYQHVEFDVNGNMVAGAAPALHLVQGTLEEYEAGQQYQMLAPEMHRATPENGTVTVRLRQHVSPRMGVHVYWMPGEGPGEIPTGTKVILPKPGSATAKEIEDVTGHALFRWF